MSRSMVRKYRLNNEHLYFHVGHGREYPLTKVPPIYGRVFRKQGKSFPKVHAGVNNTKKKNAILMDALVSKRRKNYGYSEYDRSNSEWEF